MGYAATDLKSLLSYVPTSDLAGLRVRLDTSPRPSEIQEQVLIEHLILHRQSASDPLLFHMLNHASYGVLGFALDEALAHNQGDLIPYFDTQLGKGNDRSRFLARASRHGSDAWMRHLLAITQPVEQESAWEQLIYDRQREAFQFFWGYHQPDPEAVVQWIKSGDRAVQEVSAHRADEVFTMVSAHPPLRAWLNKMADLVGDRLPETVIRLRALDRQDQLNNASNVSPRQRMRS